MMIKLLIAASLFSMLGQAVAPARLQTEAEPPATTALWTISSDNCVSVHADGEPWDECGFQAFDMNADGSRTLTVDATGIVQLWDGDGREIRRIEWPNQPSGASGYPDGRALIAGGLGIAVVHQNQLLVIDLSDGRTLAQQVAEKVMMIDQLAHVGAGRVFAAIKDRDWNGGAREIILPAGELRVLPGLTDLMRVGPGYWMMGTRTSFTLHRVGATPAKVASERSCMPLDANHCVWRDLPGSSVHILDVKEGRWQSFDLGRMLDGSHSLDVVSAGGQFYAVICGPHGPRFLGLRPCSITELATRRTIHSFKASSLRAVGAVDEQGRPEIRLALDLEPNRRESRRVSIDGSMRVIDLTGRVNLSAPSGGMVLAAGENASVLVDAAGLQVARLPFDAQSCGGGWPTWTAGCRFTDNKRKWLVPSNRLPENGLKNEMQLTLYAIPSGDR
jgi:hypothetical protein